MLTGRDAEDDVVRGLDAGANYYFINTFWMQELLARLRAQLRVFDNTADAVFIIGPFLFRPAAREMLDRASGRKLILTGKETAILKFLHRAGGKPVSRQVLLNEI